MATTQFVQGARFRSPEKASVRELRRKIIDSSPRRYETDAEGREWLVVRLPDPGELWVVRVAEIPASDELGDSPPDYNLLDDGNPDTA